MVDACHNRRHKVRSEPPLVQTTRHQVRHGLRGDISLFSEPVHVDFVAEEIGDGGYVCCKTRETKVDLIAEGKYLGIVVGDRQGLETKTEVTGYGHAVFANHGHAGAAIDREG